MNGSSFIVNHRVALSSSPDHAAIGKSRLLYIANRQGAVLGKTEDDLRIARENERVAKLGYIAFRPGSVAERNSGHALFDQSGVPERARIQQELKTARGAILTSVVSVRREDAEALGLSTKQDWERFLRANWESHIEAMGIMERHDMRWVAAFHVNQVNNLHCHVFTWSKSGDFDSLVPKQKLASAQQSLASLALRPEQEKLSQRRTMARDQLVNAVRQACAKDETLKRIVADALPPTGSLRYGNIAKRNPASRQAIDRAAASIIERDGRTAKLYEEYLAAVSENAELKLLRGNKADAYVHAAADDIRTRIGNAIVSECRPPRTALEQMAEIPEIRVERPYAQPPLPKQRKAARAMRQEIRACLTERAREGLRRSFSEGAQPDPKAIAALPSVSFAAKRYSTTPEAIMEASANMCESLALQLNSSMGGTSFRDDAGDDAAALAEDRIARAITASIQSLLTARGAKRQLIPHASERISR